LLALSVPSFSAVVSLLSSKRYRFTRAPDSQAEFFELTRPLNCDGGLKLSVAVTFVCLAAPAGPARVSPWPQAPRVRYR
jgi:hypothetical protein